MDDIQVKNKIIPMVKFLFSSLTRSEKKAADYLLNNPEEVVGLALNEYAEKSGSSQPSIIRLCKKIGTSGYAELKLNLSMQLESDNDQPNTVIDVKPEQGITSVINSIFEINIQILKETFELVTDDYEKALAAILDAKHICFFALGDAMMPCSYAEFKLRRLGYICYADADPDMQIINACNLMPGDVAISVSHTGNTRNVINAMKIAKKKGATTICITKVGKSELAKYCDIQLFTATADITIGKEIIARRIAEQAILEALYLMVLEKTKTISAKKIRESTAAMELNKL
ncbi:MAG: MurR/RpiR family transcriptional regulator [Bacillota bacterium]|nr:MurR/RpiR family transcriptional regulator [Bacillota bacterium]